MGSPLAGSETDRRFHKYLSVMDVKIPLFNPDRLLSRLAPYLRWLFTPWILVISGIVILYAFLGVATHLLAVRHFFLPYPKES
jgi:hypothetical protein